MLERTQKHALDGLGLNQSPTVPYTAGLWSVQLECWTSVEMRQGFNTSSSTMQRRLRCVAAMQSGLLLDSRACEAVSSVVNPEMRLSHGEMQLLGKGRRSARLTVRNPEAVAAAHCS